MRSRESVGGRPADVGHDLVDLAGVAESVPQARRFVRDALTGQVAADVVDAAALCVTELATNAVLHARTDFRVRVAVLPDVVRLEVEDRSPMEPRRLVHTIGSSTGRGMEMVALLAARWGVDRPGPRTKTVWCELMPAPGADPEPAEPPGRPSARPAPAAPPGADDRLDALLEEWVDLPVPDATSAGVVRPPEPGPASEQAPEPTPEPASEPAPEPAQGSPAVPSTSDPAPLPPAPPAPPAGTAAPDVVLRGYPVLLGMRAREHTSAILRECALLALSTPSGSAPARLVFLAQQITGRYAGELASVEQQRMEAMERGEATVDLRYPARPGMRAVVENWRAVVRELDQYAAGSSLLTQVTPADQVALRDWTLGEFVAQIDGAEPTPWTGSTE